MSVCICLFVFAPCAPTVVILRRFWWNYFAPWFGVTKERTNLFGWGEHNNPVIRHRQRRPHSTNPQISHGNTWRGISRKQSEIEGWCQLNTNGNRTRGIDWSRDRWRYVTIRTNNVFCRTSSCHKYNGHTGYTVIVLDSQTLFWLLNTSHHIACILSAHVVRRTRNVWTPQKRIEVQECQKYGANFT